jgi:plastocyanin
MKKFTMYLIFNDIKIIMTDNHKGDYVYTRKEKHGFSGNVNYDKTNNKSKYNQMIITLIVFFGLSFALIYALGLSFNYFVPLKVDAQPAQDYPIPDASRMFTNDTADIRKVDRDPYILDMAILPKNITVGEPAAFVFNFFAKSSNSWLWHTDLWMTISDSSGKPIAVFPNNHGHGGVIEFEYVFPKEGTYSINLIFGQQQGSPNFMIEPKVIRDLKFNLTVYPQEKQQQLTQQASQSNSSAIPGKVRDISIKAESWKFTPNVIEVNKGDTVRLHFATAQDEVSLYIGHGFGIEKYNVNVFLLKGTEQTVEFMADKPGNFTFRCTSFCSAPAAAIENHFNMVGKLIVDE